MRTPPGPAGGPQSHSDSAPGSQGWPIVIVNMGTPTAGRGGAVRHSARHASQVVSALPTKRKKLTRPGGGRGRRDGAARLYTHVESAAALEG